MVTRHIASHSHPSSLPLENLLSGWIERAVIWPRSLKIYSELILPGRPTADGRTTFPSRLFFLTRLRWERDAYVWGRLRPHMYIHTYGLHQSSYPCRWGRLRVTSYNIPYIFVEYRLARADSRSVRCADGGSASCAQFDWRGGGSVQRPLLRLRLSQ